MDYYSSNNGLPQYLSSASRDPRPNVTVPSATSRIVAAAPGEQPAMMPPPRMTAAAPGEAGKPPDRLTPAEQNVKSSILSALDSTYMQPKHTFRDPEVDRQLSQLPAPHYAQYDRPFTRYDLPPPPPQQQQPPPRVQNAEELQSGRMVSVAAAPGEFQQQHQPRFVPQPMNPEQMPVTMSIQNGAMATFPPPVQPPPPQTAYAPPPPPPGVMLAGKRPWPRTEEVMNWTPAHVAGWISSMGYQRFASRFETNKITGELLMKMADEDLDADLQDIGVSVAGTRMLMCDDITQLKRVYKKPKTNVLEVPNYFGRLSGMITFEWAETSEGKSGHDAREEIFSANLMTALVSTIVWAICWNLFFGSNQECFCNVPTETDCWCATGFDIRPDAAVAVFYFCCAVATFLFMFSTMYAVMQMIMVNELSDDTEIVNFTGAGQYPGILFVIGVFFLNGPIFIFCIFNYQMGTRWVQYRDDMQIRTFSWLLLVCVPILFAHAFLVVIPRMVGYVYQAKVAQAKKDLEPREVDGPWQPMGPPGPPVQVGGQQMYGYQ